MLGMSPLSHYLATEGDSLLLYDTVTLLLQLQQTQDTVISEVNRLASLHTLQHLMTIYL